MTPDQLLPIVYDELRSCADKETGIAPRSLAQGDDEM